MAESAFFDYSAAVFEANVSGSDVPKATKVIAVTAGLSPITHPNSPAISPTIAVTIPIKDRATQKANHPFQIFLGGISAKNTFHPIARKWKMASKPVTSSIAPSSSMLGPSMIADLNCPDHVFSFYSMKYWIILSVSSFFFSKISKS
jgi:hypothetical protein